MEQNQAKFINTKILGWAIPISNLILFSIFYASQSEVAKSVSNFWNFIWEYMGTDIFMLVNGSIIIPLFFAHLEKRYQFFENMQKEREAKRKIAIELKRKGRQEAVDATFAMWQELYCLISEITTLVPGSDKKIKLNDISRRMINYASSAEHIVNKWSHQFPEILKKEDHDLFLEFINILFQSGFTVVNLISETGSAERIRQMQGILFRIQDQVKNILNHPIMNVFKYASAYLELTENEGSQEEMARVRKSMENELNILRGWYDSIQDLDQKHDNLLVPAIGTEVDNLRKTARSIEKWLQEHKEQYINEASDFETFCDQFNAISLETKIENLYLIYSEDYLKALAEKFSFEAACAFVYNRAHGYW